MHSREWYAVKSSKRLDFLNTFSSRKKYWNEGKSIETTNKQKDSIARTQNKPLNIETVILNLIFN